MPMGKRKSPSRTPPPQMPRVFLLGLRRADHRCWAGPVQNRSGVGISSWSGQYPHRPGLGSTQVGLAAVSQQNGAGGEGFGPASLRQKRGRIASDFSHCGPLGPTCPGHSNFPGSGSVGLGRFLSRVPADSGRVRPGISRLAGGYK